MEEKTTIPTPKAKRTEPFWKELNKVLDPEMNIGVVDIGLIYTVDIDPDGVAEIKMTLTTPSCPYGPMIIDQVGEAMTKTEGVKTTNIKIVWDPMWHQGLMDPEIKEFLMGF